MHLFKIKAQEPVIWYSLNVSKTKFNKVFVEANWRTSVKVFHAKMELFKNLFLHVFKDESYFQIVKLDYFINFTRNIITQPKEESTEWRRKSLKVPNARFWRHSKLNYFTLIYI